MGTVLASITEKQEENSSVFFCMYLFVYWNSDGFPSPCRDSWCQEGHGRVRAGLRGCGKDGGTCPSDLSVQKAPLSSGSPVGTAWASCWKQTFTERLLCPRSCG